MYTSIHIQLYLSLSLSIYIYIYIYRLQVLLGQVPLCLNAPGSLGHDIYIYIYMYTCIQDAAQEVQEMIDMMVTWKYGKSIQCAPNTVSNLGSRSFYTHTPPCSAIRSFIVLACWRWCVRVCLLCVCVCVSLSACRRMRYIYIYIHVYI